MTRATVDETVPDANSLTKDNLLHTAAKVQAALELDERLQPRRMERLLRHC
jgi:hypothetical protein